MKPFAARVCMICEEKSSELTNVTFTKDDGEVIPITINGKEYNSVCLCPDCHFAIPIMFAKNKISEMNRRS